MNKQLKIWLPLFLGLLTACSPKSRVEVLSFFFDGVPREASGTAESAADSTAGTPALPDSLLSLAPAAPPYYYHKPYLEKRCTSCHDSTSVGDLLRPEPDLCYTCHEDFRPKFKALHGPVDAGYCIVCHQPHMSKNPGLLSAGKNEHCFPCHITYEVRQPEDHVEIGDKLCVKCHDPHGIKDKIPKE